MSGKVEKDDEAEREKPDAFDFWVGRFFKIAFWFLIVLTLLSFMPFFLLVMW